MRVCQIFGCEHYRESDDIATLAEPVTHKATLFTLHNGALPVFTTSTYCRGKNYFLQSFSGRRHITGCNRRYYHNYFVHKQGNTRTYYAGVPQYLQVAQHFFIESSVLELFTTGKVFGWYVPALNMPIANSK